MYHKDILHTLQTKETDNHVKFGSHPSEPLLLY
jgi:hypothetical protein